MDDAKIVELYWARSDAALTETVKKFGPYCHTIAYNVLENVEDSEECVNDTYMRAWNSMPDKRPAALAPYLGRITRNLALNRIIEKNTLKRGGGEAALALDELDECTASSYSLEREVESREIAAAMNRFLSKLPETERALFVSRYWFMAPVRELAEKFGFSESKTVSMLRRTRLKLGKFLTGEGLV